MLNNTKKSVRGFTIVELLIVIVVIAILAAISIVAYNGIQNRGKASSGQSLASQIAKKAEAFNTVESSYPANTAGFGTGAGSAGNPPEAKLDNAGAVKAYTAGAGSGGVGAPATYDNGNSVVYRARTGGACVFWWDYAAATPIQKVITAGAAVATGTTAGTGCVAAT